MVAPVAGYKTGAYYKKYGRLWSLGYHTGVDFPCPVGTNVVACSGGKVVRSGWDNSFGNYIAVDITIGGIPYRWYVCHLSKRLVSVGQTVKTGQHIGESGDTGNSSGPHVHLELRRAPYGFNSKDIVDPVTIINYTAGPVTDANIPLLFDAGFLNVGWDKWFGIPWTKRAKGIELAIADEASVMGFAEVYSEEQVESLLRANPNFKRAYLYGKGGKELIYDSTKWLLQREAQEYKVPGLTHGVYVVHLIRRENGMKVCFIVLHAPALYPALREKYGDYLELLIPHVDDELKVILGDLNNSDPDRSPRKQIAELGFKGMRAQARIVNESVPEFKGKGTWLSEIFTDPDKLKITGGKLEPLSDLLTDHEYIEARCVAA